MGNFESVLFLLDGFIQMLLLDRFGFRQVKAKANLRSIACAAFLGLFSGLRLRNVSNGAQFEGRNTTTIGETRTRPIAFRLDYLRYLDFCAVIIVVLDVFKRTLARKRLVSVSEFFATQTQGRHDLLLLFLICVLLSRG
jgi:hypothetical protein